MAKPGMPSDTDSHVHMRQIFGEARREVLATLARCEQRALEQLQCLEGDLLRSFSSSSTLGSLRWPQSSPGCTYEDWETHTYLYIAILDQVLPRSLWIVISVNKLMYIASLHQVLPCILRIHIVRRCPVTKGL